MFFFQKYYLTVIPNLNILHILTVILDLNFMFLKYISFSNKNLTVSGNQN
jgi:hypothetical protein